MPISIFSISGLVAYPTHQAVQSIGSTALHYSVHLVHSAHIYLFLKMLI